MRCPHCNTGIHLESDRHVYQSKMSNSTSGYEIYIGFCPECEQIIIGLKQGEYQWIEEQGELTTLSKQQILFPTVSARFLDQVIPEKYRQVFQEANAVLNISPKASAALSRRLLQQLLRDEYHILGKIDLRDEISDFINRSDIPDDIKSVVDEIRQIGNWAAHPTKYRNSGEIVEVEPGEAEWLLDILEDILDLRFVQPSLAKKRSDKYIQKKRSISR